MTVELFRRKFGSLKFFVIRDFAHPTFHYETFLLRPNYLAMALFFQVKIRLLKLSNSGKYHFSTYF